MPKKDEKMGKKERQRERERERESWRKRETRAQIDRRFLDERN